MRTSHVFGCAMCFHYQFTTRHVPLRPPEPYTESVVIKFGQRQKRWLRILWLAAAIAVIVGSLLPGSSFPMRTLGQLNISDKVLHFAGYAVLAFLPSLHERWPAVTATLLGAAALGVLLEFLQRLSWGRSFEVADMLADACGLMCGLLVALPLRS
jgi:VanZ family protein